MLRYTWWGNPDRAARTEEAVALFEKRHPDIDIQTSFSGYEPYKQKLATQAAGGDAPDVMQLDYRRSTSTPPVGVLLDLAKQQAGCSTAEIDKGLLATGVVDGKQYAHSRGTRHRDDRVRHEAVEGRASEPPREGWTWSDWADAMRALAKKTGKPGGTDPGQSEDAFEVWLRGQGKALYTKDRRLGFTADDLTAWWTFTDKLRREGAVSPAEETTQIDGAVENTPLGRGKAISDMNWDAPASGFLALIPDGLALAPMPSGEDGTPGQYFKPSMFMGVAAEAPHPKQAAQFIDFMLNDHGGGEDPRRDPRHPRQRDDPRGGCPELKDFDKTIADYQASLDGNSTPRPQAPPRATAPCRPPSSATTTRCRTSGCRPARRPRTTSPRRRRSCGHDHHRPRPPTPPAPNRGTPATGRSEAAAPPTRRAPPGCSSPRGSSARPC